MVLVVLVMSGEMVLIIHGEWCVVAAAVALVVVVSGES